MNAKSAKIAESVEIADFAKIAETEIGRFRGMFEIYIFLKKGLFEKKLEFHSKSLKVANLLSIEYQLVLFLENVFRPIYEVFSTKKVRKLRTLENLI